MTESPGWFIVCHKCGIGEQEGYQLIATSVTGNDATEIQAVVVTHYREVDDTALIAECPKELRRTDTWVRPKGEGGSPDTQ